MTADLINSTNFGGTDIFTIVVCDLFVVILDYDDFAEFFFIYSIASLGGKCFSFQLFHFCNF